MFFFFKFTLGADFNVDSIGYIARPKLAEKAHCIALVIDSSKVEIMRNDMWRKLRSLQEGLLSRSKWTLNFHCIHPQKLRR